MNRCKTQIYGTLGPACADPTVLKEMAAWGMTGLRLNLSHGNLEERKPWLAMVRRAEAELGIRMELLIDLQGPELRCGRVSVELKEGSQVLLGRGGIPIPEMLEPYLKPGRSLLLDDGRLLLETMEGAGPEAVPCRVLRGGYLGPEKSIALPGIEIERPALTDTDRENIRHAKEWGVTGVMQPFVRSEDDLRELKEALEENGGGDMRIFAKLENRRGVERLPQLLPYADEIVIARGDLGNDMPLWELPAVQYQVGQRCREAGKPYMVVTQMLSSMEHAAVPTRAEVSDIFYAVLHGASSVMVTGETAAGEYPVEVMKYLCQTVRVAEQMNDYLSHRPLAPQGSIKPFSDTGRPIS